MVIEQLYGGGGNSGASFRNDYVVLFNTGNLPVDLTGWSIQYQAATSSGSWQVTDLPPSAVVEPFSYYLVQESAGASPLNSSTPHPLCAPMR
jgi:hypothetical protein